MPPDFPKPDPAVRRLLNQGLVDRGLSSGVHVQKDPRWERVLRVTEATMHIRFEGRICGRIEATRSHYLWSVRLSLASGDELESGSAPSFDHALAIANRLIDAYDAADRLSGGRVTSRSGQSP